MSDPKTLRLTILAALALSGCETYEGEVCLTAESYGECPSSAEAAKDIVGPGCGYRTLSVDGEATFVAPPEDLDTEDTGWWWWSGEAGENGRCCYPVTQMDVNDGCVVGRPLQLAGETRAAEVVPGTGWAQAAKTTLPAAVRTRLADHWAHQARGEHASVAAFNRLSLELLQLGAPAELLAQVQQAALDEVHHAREAFQLASRYAGQALAPAPLALDALRLATDWRSVGLAAAIEGCLNETLAVAVATASLDASTDPLVRAHLTRVVADERRHAALSWQLLAHALRQAPELLVEIDAVFADASVPTVHDRPSHPVLAAHGLLGPDTERAVLADALATVVRPCWAALRASL